MESSKYSYSVGNGYTTTQYLKPSTKGTHGNYGNPSGATRFNKGLDMQCESPPRKGSYLNDSRLNDSYLSENAQNASTNFTNRSSYTISQDFTNNSFNTARNSTGSKLAHPGRKQLLPKPPKPILSVLNKASNFWSDTLGFKLQENESPMKSNCHPHFKQKKEAVYHQQEPAVVKKMKQIPSSNSLYERYSSNQDSAIYESKMSESGYGLQNETSSYTGENHGHIIDDHSSVSQTPRTSQPTGTRNNTLYKCLNQYFDGSQSKSSKTTKGSQKQRQSFPQVDFEESIDETAELLPENLKTDPSASGSSPTNELNRLATASSHSLENKRLQRGGSSLLRSKLEAHHTALSSTPRTGGGKVKTKAKDAPRLRNLEREQLIQLLINKKEQDAEKVTDETDNLKTSSQLIREHYTSDLNANLRKIRFSLQEDQAIAHYYKKHGSNWKMIAKHLPGRTETMIRNRFYSTIKKKKPELLSGEFDFADSRDEKETHDVDVAKPVVPQTDPGTQNSQGIKIIVSEFELEHNNTDSTANPLQLKDCDLESDFKELPLKNDGLFAEPDLFGRGLFLDSIRKNNCEIEFGCLSPVVNSSMPYEWERNNLLVPELKFPQEDPFGFSPQLLSNNNEVLKNSTAMPEENYLSYLADFSQEPLMNKEIDLEDNSMSSTIEKKRDDIEEEPPVKPPAKAENERSLLSQQQSKLNDLKAELQGGLIPEGGDAGSNKIFTLVNQIKSIEMLFNLTRKEIQKLQCEFGN